MSGVRRYRKEQRLGRDAIVNLLNNTKPRREGDLLLLSRPNGMSYARFGSIIPKRHLARAVDRNRIRRLLREWFRHNQERFVGVDLLVRLRAQPGDLDALVSRLARFSPGR